MTLVSQIAVVHLCNSVLVKVEYKQWVLSIMVLQMQLLHFYDGSVSASNLVQSYTNVMPGDSLLFSGNGNKFSSGSNFTINGGPAIEIHLSCSQPVQGETFGGVLYVYGTQDDDGNCCNLDCPPPCPGLCM